MDELLEYLKGNPDIAPICTVVIRKIAQRNWKKKDLIFLDYIPSETWNKYSLFSAVDGLIYFDDLPISLDYVNELCQKQFPILYKSFVEEKEI